MKILAIREATVPIGAAMSNAAIAFDSMTASALAIVTDRVQDGKPVVGYAFEFSQETCDEAQRRFPDAPQIAKIREVLDANGTALTMRPLLDFADSILLARGMVRAVRVEAPFEAWAHPAGGRGVVFGWEIRRPEMDEGFDPRHPW